MIADTSTLASRNNLNSVIYDYTFNMQSEKKIRSLGNNSFYIFDANVKKNANPELSNLLFKFNTLIINTLYVRSYRYDLEDLFTPITNYSNLKTTRKNIKENIDVRNLNYLKVNINNDTFGGIRYCADSKIVHFNARGSIFDMILFCSKLNNFDNSGLFVGNNRTIYTLPKSFNNGMTKFDKLIKIDNRFEDIYSFNSYYAYISLAKHLDAALDTLIDKGFNVNRIFDSFNEKWCHASSIERYIDLYLVEQYFMSSLCPVQKDLKANKYLPSLKKIKESTLTSLSDMMVGTYKSKMYNLPSAFYRINRYNEPALTFSTVRLQNKVLKKSKVFKNYNWDFKTVEYRSVKNNYNLTDDTFNTNVNYMENNPLKNPYNALSEEAKSFMTLKKNFDIAALTCDIDLMKELILQGFSVKSKINALSESLPRFFNIIANMFLLIYTSNKKRKESIETLSQYRLVNDLGVDDIEKSMFNDFEESIEIKEKREVEVKKTNALFKEMTELPSSTDILNFAQYLVNCGADINASLFTIMYINKYIMMGNYTERDFAQNKCTIYKDILQPLIYEDGYNRNFLIKDSYTKHVNLPFYISILNNIRTALYKLETFSDEINIGSNLDFYKTYLYIDTLVKFLINNFEKLNLDDDALIILPNSIESHDDNFNKIYKKLYDKMNHSTEGYYVKFKIKELLVLNLAQINNQIDSVNLEVYLNSLPDTDRMNRIKDNIKIQIKTREEMMNSVEYLKDKILKEKFDNIDKYTELWKKTPHINESFSEKYKEVLRINFIILESRN